MNKAVHVFSALLFLAGVFACTTNNTTAGDPGGGGTGQVPPNILVFSKTEGFRHASIPKGVEVLEQMGQQESYLSVSATEDASQISTANLESYGAVLFLNTSGDVLNETQQQALKQFIQGGGGFMGVHAATDTELEWPWYGRMIGAYFDGHPEIQEAKLYVMQNSHQSTQYLPGIWTRTDEWYNFRDIQEHINPLINLDESSYEGGENGENHPAAWFHEFEGGRVFYTAGGHTEASYEEPLFTRHLLGGMKYVLGITQQ